MAAMIPLVAGPDEPSVEQASVSMTMTFVVMGLGTVFNAIANRRDPATGFGPPILKALVIAMIPVTMLFLGTQLPTLQQALLTTTLSPSQWLICAGLLALAVGLLAVRAGAGPGAGLVVLALGAGLVLRRPLGRWAPAADKRSASNRLSTRASSACRRRDRPRRPAGTSGRPSTASHSAIGGTQAVWADGSVAIGAGDAMLKLLGRGVAEGARLVGRVALRVDLVARPAPRADRGEPTDEMRDRFTRVLRGHIAIARAIFPDGATGAQLDTLARQYLWAAGVDFEHGTGHGVGSYLSVHEGPARISKLGTTPLKRGMVVLTGSMVPIQFPQPGDRALVEVAGLGTAELVAT